MGKRKSIIKLNKEELGFVSGGTLSNEAQAAIILGCLGIIIIAGGIYFCCKTAFEIKRRLAMPNHG